MLLTVEPGFAEHSVFHFVRRSPDLEALYQRDFAACHEERDPDRRDEAFAELHRRWFERLGFRRTMLEFVDEFPQIEAKVERMALVESRGRAAPGMDLYGAPGRHTLAAAMTPTQWHDRDALAWWARFELLHIDDILNPEFAYVVGNRPGARNAAAANLVHDRYSVLWALSVYARLAARGLAPPDDCGRRRDEFVRAFGLPASPEADALFEQVREEAAGRLLTHPELLDRARAGLAPPGAEGESEQSRAAPLAGSPCPLCGFQTFDWAAPSRVAAVADLVAGAAPAWTPDFGLCGRCAEVYEARRRSAPAVVESAA